MPRLAWLIGALTAVAVAGPADARPGKGGGDAAQPEYGQDVISVVTGQHEAVPTGNCIVWANAEGLGVGRQQLGGYHGVAMNLNIKPMGKDPATPTTFASGLAEMKARFPTAPQWLLKTIEKNQPAIEAACAEDHETPFTIHKITAADQHG